MKRKVISVLVLALVALMGVTLVSCQDMLPVADDAVVEAVVDHTLGVFDDFFEPIMDIAAEGIGPDIVKAAIKANFELELTKVWGAGFTLTVDADTTSISLQAKSADGKQSLDLNFTGFKASTAPIAVSGSFNISTSLKDAGAASVHNMSAKGDFNLTEMIPGNSTITYSDVSDRGTEYDLDKFNSKMASEIKDWDPSLSLT